MPTFLTPPSQRPATPPPELLTPAIVINEDEPLIPSADISKGLKAVAEARTLRDNALIEARPAFDALADTSSFDQAAYALAAEKGGALKKAQATLSEQIEAEVVAPARKVKQFADLFKNTALAGAESLIEQGRILYTGYRKAEEDRLKLAAEKAAADARAIQELNAKHAEALLADAARDEENRRLERAVEAEKSGDHLRAAVILDTPGTVDAPAPTLAPMFMPPPMPATNVARVNGEVRKKKRVGRVVDPAALLRAFADGKLALLDKDGKSIVTIKQSYLNEAAKSFGDKVGLYLPGVVCVEVEDTDFR